MQRGTINRQRSVDFNVRFSGHSAHGRTRCLPAPVAIDPERTYTCIGGCHIASVQKIGERLSFWDPGLAHAFIRALAPGEIGRIVGRWA